MSSNKKTMPSKVLNFTVKNVEVCIDLDNIVQIIQLSLLKQVPKTPNYFAGLMNYYGLSIPVIDLALRLKLIHNDSYTLDTPIIICTSHHQQIGVIVDKIKGISDIHEGALRYHDELKKPDSPFIASVLIDTQLSLLLNLDQILDTKMEYSK